MSRTRVAPAHFIQTLAFLALFELDPGYRHADPAVCASQLDALLADWDAQTEPPKIWAFAEEWLRRRELAPEGPAVTIGHEINARRRRLADKHRTGWGDHNDAWESGEICGLLAALRIIIGAANTPAVEAFLAGLG